MLPEPRRLLLLCTLLAGSAGCAIAVVDQEPGGGAKGEPGAAILADADPTAADARTPDAKLADGGTPTADTAPGPAADSGATDTPATDAGPSTYPPGPYGLTTGDTFPDLNLLGHRKGATAATMIALDELYDPTGAKKVNAIYLAVQAMGSGESQSQEAFFRDAYATKYEPRGARVLSAIVEDSLGAPPSVTWLSSWMSTYKITHDLLADPERSTLPKGATAWPRSYAIDPRTMRIESVTDGMPPSYKWGPTIVELDALLAKNGG